MATAKLNPVVKKLKGNIGGLVICRRRGVTYLRSSVTPRNPRTAKQMNNRNRFTMAVKAWQDMSETDKDKYRYRARRKRCYGYNLFISEYMQEKSGDNPAGLPEKFSASAADAAVNCSNPVLEQKTALNIPSYVNRRYKSFLRIPSLYKT
jgi:hypothetical protein